MPTSWLQLRANRLREPLLSWLVHTHINYPKQGTLTFYTPKKTGIPRAKQQACSNAEPEQTGAETECAEDAKHAQPMQAYERSNADQFRGDLQRTSATPTEKTVPWAQIYVNLAGWPLSINTACIQM
jgi:hypothetical protein